MDMLNLKIIIGSTRPGRAADQRTTAAATIMLDDLAWWGTTLRQARSAGTLPPAIMRLMAAAK